jgi:hypothetical protein
MGMEQSRHMMSAQARMLTYITSTTWFPNKCQQETTQSQSEEYKTQEVLIRQECSR